jgi:OmcA/MtrC family decaheme c-type cytochrome
MCHNPNNTDAAYRTSGAEESIDFKRMIHGIHAGRMRKNPLIVIGRNGSVNDYSHVRFPAELRNCVKCHIDVNRKGTFELPLVTKLGSTVSTGSFLGSNQIDINPANDLKISPIAATCSGCHDDSETKQHMIQMGAMFGVAQSVLEGKEQCVNCHGPGKFRDVRKEHDIASAAR